jgi:hypothetical protein
MRKARTRLPEQGTQTPSPAPDLIPAETRNQPRTHMAIGTANGGTSLGRISGGIHFAFKILPSFQVAYTGSELHRRRSQWPTDSPAKFPLAIRTDDE